MGEPIKILKKKYSNCGIEYNFIPKYCYNYYDRINEKTGGDIILNIIFIIRI